MASNGHHKQHRLRILALCLIGLSLFSGGLLGQSSDKPASYFVFPRFVAFDDVSTGIALFNPSAREASVSIVFTSADGAQAGDAVTIKVPGRGQVAKTSAELFAAANGLDGWITVSSSTAGIIANYQTFDAAATFMDGAEGVNDDLSLVFPVVPGPEEGIAEIDLLNSNPRPTTVDLSLWNYDGALLGKASLQLPAGAVYRNLASDVFPAGTSFSKASHVTASSRALNVFSQAQTFSGTSLFAGFSSVAGSTGLYDFAALNAVPLSRLSTTGVIPYFRTGRTSASILSLVNAEPASVDVDLTIIGNSGSTLGTRTITLKSHGGLRTPLPSIFSGLTSGEKEGWVLLRASGKIHAAVLYGRSDSSGLTAIPLQKSPSFELITPQISQGSGRSTELTLVNPSSIAIAASIYVVLPGGATVTNTSVALGPGARFSKSLSDLFPEMQNQSGGYIYVRATQPVFGTAILGTDNGDYLANLGSQPLSASFVPPQRKVFAIVGKVTVEGEPAAGYKIVLVGPVSTSATSAADGNYLFSDLPAGSYTIAIVHTANLIFEPEIAKIEIIAATVKQDFQGYKKPSIYGIVTLDDKPVANYVITLSGAASLTVKSGADGAYSFNDLSYGSYSLAIEYPSTQEFVPQKADIELARASRRQDFRGFTKPAVSGLITMNGKPFGGLKIDLTGPVNQTTNSADDGTYVFKYLPAGSYSITLYYPKGFIFIPDKVEFTLDRTSKRFDFPGLTPPNSIVVVPLSLPVGSADTAVTVYGTRFSATSEAWVDLVLLKTKVVDSTKLQIEIPAFLMAIPSQFNIRVVTPVPDGEPSLSDPFLFSVCQSAPSLSDLATEGVILEGGPASTITLTGTGFLKGVKVKINGKLDDIVVNMISDTEILAEVPASYFEKGGVFPVAVVNPFPEGAESNVQLMTVYYPAPAVQEIWPGSAPAKLEPGAGPLTIDVIGYGFRRGAVVLINQLPVTTFYCENDFYCLSTHMWAHIPANMLRSSGFLQINVKNPDPALANSETVFLRIDGLQPTITSVVPGTATALNLPGKYSLPIVITGTNFGAQTLVRFYRVENTAPPDFTAPQVISSTQIYAFLEVDYAAIGEWRAEVMNPQPGGGQSLPENFFIAEGAFTANPFIISLFPEAIPNGASGFTLVINGTNFQTGALVRFNAAELVPLSISERQIRVEIPGSLIRTPGKVPVSVTNPDTGGTSNRLYVDIR